MHGLTTVAALPRGAGRLSALPAEQGEQPPALRSFGVGSETAANWTRMPLVGPEPDKVQMMAPYFRHPDDGMGIYALERGEWVRIGDIA